MGLAPGTGDEIQAFRGISRIDDLPDALRADETAHGLFRAVVGFRRGQRENMRAPVGIAVAADRVFKSGFQHGKRLLRRRGVVEIYRGPSRADRFQNREIIPNRIYIHRHSPCSSSFSRTAASVSSRRLSSMRSMSGRMRDSTTMRRASSFVSPRLMR